MRSAAVTADPNPERALILRARAGDAVAFRALVDQYLPRVVSVARNVVGRAEDAEDVAQEVFFKVYRKLDTFREDSAFFTWLYRVTVNTANDFLKQRSTRPSRGADDFVFDAVADPHDTPAAGVARDELQAEVRAAMQELPPQFRAALVLREIEQLSYEDIARIMKTAIGTVESRIFRARARLKVILERRLGDG